MKHIIIILFLLFSNTLLGQTYSNSIAFEEFCFIDYKEQLLFPEKFEQRNTPEKLLAHYMQMQENDDLSVVKWGMAKNIRKGNSFFIELRTWKNLRVKMLHKAQWKVDDNEFAVIKMTVLGNDDEQLASMKTMIKKGGEWYFIDRREKMDYIAPMYDFVRYIKTDKFNALLSQTPSSDSFVNEVRKKVRRDNGLDIGLLKILFSEWRREKKMEKFNFFNHKRTPF